MEIKMDQIIADHYGPKTAETYDAMAFDNFWSYPEALRAVATEIVWGSKTFCNHQQMKILDIGAGTGNLSQSIVQEFVARRKMDAKDIQFTLHLFDSSPHMMTRARTKLDLSHVQSLTTQLGQLQQANWGNSYDLVVSSFAIHHLTPAEKKACVKSIWQSLRPGGMAIVLDRMWIDHPHFGVDEESFVRVVASKFFPMIKKQVAQASLEDVAAIVREQFIQDGDQPSGMMEHIQWFHEAGFEKVRCPFTSFGIAAVSGQRPRDN